MGDLDVSAQDVASREGLFARFALIARCFAVILLVPVAVCRSVGKKVGRSVVRCMSDEIGLILESPKRSLLTFLDVPWSQRPCRTWNTPIAHLTSASCADLLVNSLGGRANARSI